MSVLVASLLLWGFTLGPVIEASSYVETKAVLWAEAQSLLKPGANITLTCQSRQLNFGFQLFKDGVLLETVNSFGQQYHFPVGPVTPQTQGLYGCRVLKNYGWTELSNLAELSGPDSLAPPTLSAELVSWVTPEHNTTLVCQGWLQGVTFLLRREGDDEFLQVAEAPKAIQATFSINRAGNYSCSYRTHAAGQPSAPSAPVSIEGFDVPPPPRLVLRNQDSVVLSPGAHLSTECLVPRGVLTENIQVRRGEAVLDDVFKYAVTIGLVDVRIGPLSPADSGLYTCRYRFGKHQAWSRDSEPVELLIGDETLPAPLLQAEPSGPLQPGAYVTLQCQAPRPGLRFVLERQGPLGRQGLQRKSPEGTGAHFELRDVSVLDSGNYSCVYVDPEASFAGSKRSAHVELRVDGSLPKPQLQGLWQGPVRPGQNAVLRCESNVSGITYQLLHNGTPVQGSLNLKVDKGQMVLMYVGPEHAGKYTCRSYADAFQSELSDPVELQVAGLTLGPVTEAATCEYRGWGWVDKSPTAEEPLILVSLH
ncbi:alpha-1B-glycoprotein-like [Rhynchocyon petersi]